MANDLIIHPTQNNEAAARRNWIRKILRYARLYKMGVSVVQATMRLTRQKRKY